MTATDWIIPAITCAAAVVWAVNLRLGLRAIHRGTFHADAAITTLATLTVAALALTWSSLLYPDIIDVEASRLGITVARISLLVGGVVALIIGRRTEA